MARSVKSRHRAEGGDGTDKAFIHLPETLPSEYEPILSPPSHRHMLAARQVPLADRVALTLERHAKELCELTNFRMSADESKAVALAIPILVQLLKGGHGASAAALAIDHIAVNSAANTNAIREAGAIAPLVALLQAGAGSKAATYAAGALKVLSNSPTSSQAILAALADAATPLDAFPSLQQKLRSIATERLQRTEAGEDAAALEAALAMATAMGATDEAVMERVRSRLDELQTAAARRARRESVGLNVALPADFTCPITYDKMKDPVVASDGHSYERSAIEEVLRGPHPISPLTRATLGPTLVPNLNLRRRIEEHEAELDRMAEQMAARMAGVAAEAEEKAAAAMAAAKAEAEAAKAEAKAEAEAAKAAAKAEAEAEIEALRQQLKAKKRGRAGKEGEDEDDEEGHRAPKRRASSRRFTQSSARGSA